MPGFKQARTVEAHEGWHFQYGTNLPVVADEASPETDPFRTATGRLPDGTSGWTRAAPETRDAKRSRSPASSTETAASAGAIQRRITFTSFGQLTKVPQT